jgi:drug/metabolite transporter (DMT)-like permease
VVNRSLVGGGQLSPELVMAIRFSMAAVVMLPLLRISWPMVVVAAELAVWDWLGYFFQTLGLQSTTAGRAAFITNLTVVLVPLLGALGRRSIAPRLWVAALIAFLGVGLLAWNPGDLGRAVHGDLWVLGCAGAYAVFILRLESASRRFPPLPLTALLLLMVAVLSLASLPLAPQAAPALATLPWRALVYLGLATTALTALLQTYGQARVTAPEAAVLFCLEPLFAAGFAAVLLGESLGVQGYVGSALVLGAALLSQFSVCGRRFGGEK